MQCPEGDPSKHFHCSSPLLLQSPPRPSNLQLGWTPPPLTSAASRSASLEATSASSRRLRSALSSAWRAARSPVASRGGLPPEGLPADGLLPAEPLAEGPCRAPIREEGREPWLRRGGIRGGAVGAHVVAPANKQRPSHPLLNFTPLCMIHSRVKTALHNVHVMASLIPTWESRAARPRAAAPPPPFRQTCGRRRRGAPRSGGCGSGRRRGREGRN